MSKAKSTKASDAASDTNTYYLKPGSKYSTIVQGEVNELETPGTPVVLPDSSYEAFKDKFFTEAEYNIYKEANAVRAPEDAEDENIEPGAVEPEAPGSNVGDPPST